MVIKIPEKCVDVRAEADVLVVGGGPAGIGAAVAAARQGCRVMLLEKRGFLGGNITATLPADFDANADIGTLAGKISCDFAKVEKKSVISSYINTKFNNGDEIFKCTTSAGNIVVTKK